MLLEREFSTVSKFKGKEVLEVLKEIVFELDGEKEKELKDILDSFGEVEEVVMVSNSSTLGWEIMAGLIPSATYKDKDIRINGGWWYSYGSIGDDFEFNFLMVEDGTVNNLFVFVKTIV